MNLLRFAGRLLAPFVCLSAGLAQDDAVPVPITNPPGFHLLFRFPDGRTVFKLGEAIEFEVACTSDLPNAYSSQCPTGSSGSAPFVGSFRPEQALAAFNGGAANGTWTLHVEDLAAGDVGTIQCWSLKISTYSCMQGRGACSTAPLSFLENALPSSKWRLPDMRPFSRWVGE